MSEQNNTTKKNDLNISVDEYMNEDELLEFIASIENDELVSAPPGIKEAVFEKIDNKKKIIEYRRFRNRVIAASAAIIFITSFMFEGQSNIDARLREGYFRYTYSDNEYGELEDTGSVEISAMNSEYIDLTGNRLLGDFVNSHYVSDLFNVRED